MTTFGVEGVSVDGRLGEVNLDVPAGAITAVVGGDGAGKTTLLRLLVWALEPDSGRVLAPTAEKIGYVGTGSGYYQDLTVDENLRFVATAYGLDEAEFAERRPFVLDLTGLAPFDGRLAGHLSGGMRQKLALALGTLHNPDLLVLDEPTMGVDPVSRADLWRIIANAAATGVHVVVATSYVDEAERATNVLALDEGSVLLQGAPEDLAASTPGALVDTATPSDRGLAWRRGASWRQWLPDSTPGDLGDPVSPRLEDAVMVATIGRKRERA